MSENSRSRITITLGDTRQVVKRAGFPLDGVSVGDSELSVGRKRSVKDRLGGVGDSTRGFDNKRLRTDGGGFSQVDSSEGMGLRKDDLRFRIMRKNVCKNIQGNDQESILDLRNFLSRPTQSSSASVAVRPNIPERGDARQQFPKLGNGKQHMSERREPKKNMAESKNRRQGKVDDVLPRIQEPNRSGIVGRVPSTSLAGSLSMRRRSPDVASRRRSPGAGLRPRSPDVASRQRSPDVSFRPVSPGVALRRRLPDVTFGRRSPDEPLRRRSPDVTLKRRSPDVALRRRSPDVALRRRSPDVALRRRSPDVALRRRSPDVALRRRSLDAALRRRSPDAALRRRSPNVALRRRSPDVALWRRSPDVALRRRSPDIVLRRRSPDIVLRRRSPDVVLRRRSPDKALRRRSPDAALRRRSPDAALRRRSPVAALSRRSPDVVVSTPRGYSPQRREEELQRGPSMRSYNDRGEGTFMSKDVHDFSRPGPAGGPYMRTAALPAAHAYMSKDVHDFSRAGPSVPYMTTAALPVLNAKPMIPLPTPSMPPSNLFQRSSYMVNVPTNVDSFLKSLGLEKYSINFKAEEVDMFPLRQLGDNDLKDLGIPMGPRKKILLALQSRYNRTVP